MERTEAVCLLKEICAEHLIQPSIVSIQQKQPDDYQLHFKGDYNFEEIRTFLNERFSVEESKGYLVIFKL